jgi:hypothetical protein
MIFSLWVVLLLFVVYLVWKLLKATRNTEVPAANEPVLVSRGNLPIVGHALSALNDPDVFLTQCRKQYGDEFTLNFFGKHVTFLTSPRSSEFYFSAAEHNMSFLQVIHLCLRL